MANIKPIQTSFAAGQISPLLRGQVNSREYKEGALVVKNAVPDELGPVHRRPGMRHIHTFDAADGRIIELPYNYSTAFYLVLLSDGEGYMCDGYGIVQKGANNIAANPDFFDGARAWDTYAEKGGRVEFPQGYCEVSTTGQQGSIAVLMQTEYDDEDPIPSPLYVRINGDSADSYPLVTVSIDNDPDPTVFSNAQMFNTKDFAGTFTLDGSYNTVYFKLKVDDSNVFKRIDSFNVYTQDPDTFLEDAKITHPWSKEELIELQWAKVPNQNAMFICSPDREPRIITYSSTGFISIEEAIYTDAVDVPTWTNPFSENSGPRTLAFHAGRTWWGWGWEILSSPISDPPHIDDYRGYDVSSSDPSYSNRIRLPHRGDIQWMKGGTELMIGTEYGIYVLRSPGGTYGPGDVEIDYQGEISSAPTMPVSFGDRMLALGSSEEELWEIRFQWSSQVWEGIDIAKAYSHLAEEGSFYNVVSLTSPHKMLATLTRDNRLLMYNYNLDESTTGWGVVETDGDVRSIASVRYKGKDVLGLLVDRQNPTGSEEYSLSFEVMTREVLLDHEYLFHTDEIDVDVAEDNPYSVTIPRLANTEVRVVIDDAVMPLTTADANGKITIPYLGLITLVGLDFTMEVETLPVGMMLDAATSAGSLMKRWSKIIVRIKGQPVKVNGVRTPERPNYAQMDKTVASSIADHRVSNIGWKRNETITLEQDLPVKTTVLAVLGDLDME